MAARQRRKLVGDKAKNREKYPLAAARVIVEFKLRRAKESKVSKLWLQKKNEAKNRKMIWKRRSFKV